MPADLPDRCSFGDEREAVICGLEQHDAWEATPDALAWLADSRPERKKEAARKRNKRPRRRT
jgi:hypothetical protein